MNPVRVRLLVVLVSAFSLFAFGVQFVQVEALRRTSDEIRGSWDRSNVKLVKLFLELEYRGDWSAEGRVLRKGGEALPESEAISRSLGDYLPPDSEISFVAGEPPPDVRHGPPLLAGPPPPPPDDRFPPPGNRPPPPGEARPPRHPDFPFGTADGAGIAVRGWDGRIVGWIGFTSTDKMRAARDSRFVLGFVIGTTLVNLLVVLALGAIVFRLSKPIDLIAEAHAREAARNAELADISRRDPLTGLLNRRGIGSELEFGATHGAPPSHVAILDVDHFKEVNDERGHEEGDAVLVELAKILRGCLRHGDVCGRWGGEEFVAVLCGSDVGDEGAGAFAERLRAAVESHAFGAAGFRVTVTIGLARIGPAGFAVALAEADEELYRGKRDGRNRVAMGGRGASEVSPALRS